MTSNNQRNIPLKKRTRSLLKPQNPSLPRLRGLLRPKRQTPGLPQNPHRRRAYLDDFKKTQNGNYQYEGSRYACELSEKEWKKKSTGMAAAGIAVLLLTIAAGCVPSVGLQGSVFVLLPYAVQLAAACSLAWACARLWGKEYPLREYVYQQTVCKISLRGGICIAAAGVSVIGELAELTRHSDKLLSSIPFLLIEVIMGAAALALLKNAKKYMWKRV
ncbi:MAG: hypothetical protein ACLSCO_02520 [Gallintestinimicrobium sp.]